MVEISGGDRLARVLAEMTYQLETAASLRVGFLENARYPGGTQVAAVAAFNEFGTPNAKHPIPPRPFFRNMIAAKSPEWGLAIANLLKANQYSARRALELAGAAIQGQLKQSIVGFSGVPLAPSTVKRKGFDKQLIDTGHLLSSVDFEVI